jgi:hypothetical protein
VLRRIGSAVNFADTRGILGSEEEDTMVRKREDHELGGAVVGIWDAFHRG